MDDLNPTSNECVINGLKNVVNIFPAKIDIKNSGGTTFPDWVVVTTNYSLKQICRNDRLLMKALMERFYFLFSYKVYFGSLESG